MASIHRIGFTRYQNDLSKIFKALGHPARLAIIDHLLSQNRIMCKELAQELGFTPPTITHHAQILMQSGLLGYEKIANVTYYVVNPLLIRKAKEALKVITIQSENLSPNYSNIVFTQQPLPDSF